MRQTPDSSFENITTTWWVVPSPAATQMRNTKFLMYIPYLFAAAFQLQYVDSIPWCKPKVKLLSFYQMPAGQPGSGSPWTFFEDQALVVMAHDLGPNWGLSVMLLTVHCSLSAYSAKLRNARSDTLMDRTSGDGADSAEDSGSSQPYSSTLPGIPKEARDSYFNVYRDQWKKIPSNLTLIRSSLLVRDNRKSQGSKTTPVQHPHSSHKVALFQVCPNNLNEGPILTPLDLCEATTIAGTDMLHLGYPGPHSGGLALPNQGTATPMHPASGDARYGLPRSASLSTDE
ncbi:hypothetical protein CASFOL_035279 [Castilleja foliolosa]|uniref:Uncharacterized protein n=1 Tax=Castilleja foliolosa TaxID=1961234 RepID=A0ABD3BSW8_9LAMI